MENSSPGAGCPCVSAGHPKHEYTSPAAIDSVFTFLCEKLGQDKVADKDIQAYSYTLADGEGMADDASAAAQEPAMFESVSSMNNDDDDMDEDEEK